MPTIEVTEQDFKRLQKYAEPLVDTATTAFTRVLDLLDGQDVKKSCEDSYGAERSSQCHVFGAASIPPLKHTKVIAGSFGEQQIDKPTWDALVRLALTRLFAETSDLKLVRGGSGANLVHGKKTDDGYKYMPELNFSYQGVSAEDAIEIVVRSARVLNLSAWVEFRWRQKESAHLPGEAGRVEI